MKKFFLVFAFATFAFFGAHAQSTPLPVDESTKLVSYSAVTEIKGAQKDEIYKRALAWFMSYYKNPTSVFRKQDMATGEISGVHVFKVFRTDKSGAKNAAAEVGYTVNIFCKDGKYKYEITKLNQKGASYYGIERWMNKSDKAYKPEQDSFLQQTDEFVKTLIASITKAMEKPTGVVKKNDW